jgi:hypothetical protein
LVADWLLFWLVAEKVPFGLQYSDFNLEKLKEAKLPNLLERIVWYPKLKMDTAIILYPSLQTLPATSNMFRLPPTPPPN